MARKVEKVDKGRVKVTEETSQIVGVEDLKNIRKGLKRQEAEVARKSAMKIERIGKEIARIDEILVEVEKLK